MTTLLPSVTGSVHKPIKKVDTMNISENLKARFWAKVSMRQDSDCWRWNASKTAKGYGQINTGDELSTQAAHRVSYMIHYGAIPDGLFVCHTCDNPECTNPDHLFLGTAQENTDDMMAKGREASGMKAGSRKLDEYQVIEIRKAYANKESIDSLMGQYKVSRACITDIIAGRRWAKTAGPISKPPGKAKKLTSILVKEIYKEIGRGEFTYIEIGEMYRVNEATIRNIGAQTTWQHVTGQLPDIYHHQVKERVNKGQVINAEIALEIRRLRNDLNWPIKKVATHLGVNDSMVNDVAMGNSWADIGGTIRKSGPGKRGQQLGSARSNAKMTEEKVQRLRELHSQGWTNRELQAEFGIGAASVSNIANRKTWRHVA